MSWADAQVQQGQRTLWVQDPKASMEDLAPSSPVGSWDNGRGVVCVFPKEWDRAIFFFFSESLQEPKGRRGNVWGLFQTGE